MKKVILLMFILAGFAFSDTKIMVMPVEIDPAAAGLQNELNEADLNHITIEIRRLASKEFPKPDYVIMNEETIADMGEAVMDECNEENCIIVIAKKIGADYVTKSIVSKKSGTTFTLIIEIYDKNGFNFDISDPIEAKDVESLIRETRQIAPILFKKLIASNPETIKKLNEEQDRIRAEKAKNDARERKFFWTAVGLDVLGVGMLTYGMIKNSEINDLKEKRRYSEAESKAKTRNILYIAGGAVLAVGIGIHIAF